MRKIYLFTVILLMAFAVNGQNLPIIKKQNNKNFSFYNNVDKEAIKYILVPENYSFNDFKNSIVSYHLDYAISQAVRYDYDTLGCNYKILGCYLAVAPIIVNKPDTLIINVLDIGSAGYDATKDSEIGVLCEYVPNNAPNNIIYSYKITTDKLKTDIATAIFFPDTITPKGNYAIALDYSKLVDDSVEIMVAYKQKPSIHIRSWDCSHYLNNNNEYKTIWRSLKCDYMLKNSYDIDLALMPLIEREIPDIPEIKIKSRDICPNDNLEIIVAKDTMNYKYVWNMSNGKIVSDINSDTINVNWTTSGVKNIKLDIISKNTHCSSTYSSNIKVYNVAQAPNICIVGIDSITSKNMVVWEKDNIKSADSIYIYKETNQSDIYKKIGSIGFESENKFIDLNSSPDVKADRYKITSYDSCGYETDISKSKNHKTIHLTINRGMYGYNLIWDNYEGFTFKTYNIYRGSSVNNMKLLNSIQSNLNSYSDINPPFGNLYYQIEIVKDNVCTLYKNSKKGYISAKSNIVSSASAEGIDDINVLKYISIIPNPTNDFINITSSKNIHLEKIIITDIIGNTVFFKDNVADIDSEPLKISVQSYSKGLYTISLISKNNMGVKKLIIQ